MAGNTVSGMEDVGRFRVMIGDGEGIITGTLKPESFVRWPESRGVQLGDLVTQGMTN